MESLRQGAGPEFGPLTTKYEVPERTMLHVLRDQAAARPDKTWLAFDDGAQLTFGGAQTLVGRVADAIATDIGSGHNVALLLGNQVEFFPVLYGAMMASGAAVPLNADARGVLLQRTLIKSEARLLVARADRLEVLKQLDSLGDVQLLIITGSAAEDDLPLTVGGVRTLRWEDWIAGRLEMPATTLPNSSDIALIQFTSGTTGNAKGVVYPHHFLYLYSSTVSDGQRRGEDDILTTPLPLFHVAALHIVANSALHAGCTAYLRAKFSASRFWQEIADCGASFAIILGPLAAILLRTVHAVPEHRLRQLFCLPFPADGEEFERRFGVKILWQGYGMTEVYPHPMQREMEADVPYDTVGRPAAYMDFGVVDEHDRVLPAGQLGELVYRPRIADAMAREYYKDPAATLKAFRNFMFHTGDVGYVDEQGRVHYGGRLQDRIRRRGENVSAAELEFVAMGHEKITEAAALGVPGEFGEDEIKLDVASFDPNFDLDEYHTWLKQRLPKFMVPLYLELHEELPKSASAKVMKNKLLAAGIERSEVQVYDPRADAADGR